MTKRQFAVYEPLLADPKLLIHLYRDPKKQRRVTYFFHLQRGDKAVAISFRHQHPKTHRIIPGPPTVAFAFDICRSLCDSTHENIDTFRRYHFGASDATPASVARMHKLGLSAKRKLRQVLGDTLYLHLITADLPGLADCGDGNHNNFLAT